MYCKSAEKIFKQWKASAIPLRLGQYFVNKYTPVSISSELFSETDVDKAKLIINTWLIDNQYTDILPPH